MKIKIFQFLCLIGLVFMASCAQDTKTNTTDTEKPSIKVKEPEKADNSRNAVVQKQAATKNNMAKAATGASKLVNWVDINELETAQKKEKRKVMVDLYTDWCGWCKKMDKATFEHPKIANYMNDKFYAVKFNAEYSNDISFGGKAHKFVKAGRKGYNELAHKFANGRMSYPTIAFLDENNARINSFPGFKQPDQFDSLLKFIEGDHYKTTSLQEFQRGYKSDIPKSAPPAKKRSNIKINPNQVKVQQKTVKK